MKEVSLLEKKLAERPIKVPGNPFWEFTKEFSKTELRALATGLLCTSLTEIDAIGSPIAGFFNVSREAVNALAAPVGEKPMFFYDSTKEAIDVFRETPKDKRKSLGYYLWNAIKGGAPDLGWDLAVHDPLQSKMVYEGQRYLPEVPVALIMALSFGIAVAAVGALKVGVDEIKYSNFKRNLKKIGFGVEQYYESRFLLVGNNNPEEVLEDLAKKFNLNHRQTGEYHDRYANSCLPEYSGRSPKLRLRDRKIEDEERRVRSAQIVYTKATAMAEKNPSQFNFFPQRKDKIYLTLPEEGEMPARMEDIADLSARKVLVGAKQDDNYQEVRFTRNIARDDQRLLVAVDKVQTLGEIFHVLELKVRTDTLALKEAMRYAMLNFPLAQTTYGKRDLVNFIS